MGTAPRRAQTKSVPPPPMARSNVGEICSVIKTGFWAAVAIVFCLQAKECIVALAGRDTFAKIVFGMLVDFKVSIAWGAAIAASAVALGERRNRRNTTARLEGRIHQLETDIDPERTSSHLTRTGQTNPGDR